MPHKKTIYLGFIVLMLIIGCGLKQGVVQKEPKSFLWFTGNTEDAIVYIDDLNPIILSAQVYVDKDENGDANTYKPDVVHYEITPGKHTIIVEKDGKEVVNRIVLLGDGITKEIPIP